MVERAKTGAHRLNTFLISLWVNYPGFPEILSIARFGADIVGCHLWDKETGMYNMPFIRQLMPGRRVALLTLAHRRLGLIVQRGNPAKISELRDLARPDVRFINRQWGAGTRLWLDNQLGIASEGIDGYQEEVNTHLEVAGTCWPV